MPSVRASQHQRVVVVRLVNDDGDDDNDNNIVYDKDEVNNDDQEDYDDENGDDCDDDNDDEDAIGTECLSITTCKTSKAMFQMHRSYSQRSIDRSHSEWWCNRMMMLFPSAVDWMKARQGKASTLTTAGNEGTPQKKRSRVVVVKIISLPLIEWMVITHVYD